MEVGFGGSLRRKNRRNWKVGESSARRRKWVLQEEKEMELGTGLGLGLEEEREMRERGEGEGNAEQEKRAKVCFYFQEIFCSRGKRLGFGNPYR